MRYATKEEANKLRRCIIDHQMRQKLMKGYEIYFRTDDPSVDLIHTASGKKLTVGLCDLNGARKVIQVFG